MASLLVPCLGIELQPHDIASVGHIATDHQSISLPTGGPKSTISWNVSGFMPASSRSEEHTSELQSLMRISYAVFCLKKKIINNTTKSNIHNQQLPNLINQTT